MQGFKNKSILGQVLLVLLEEDFTQKGSVRKNQQKYCHQFFWTIKNSCS